MSKTEYLISQCDTS